MNLVWVPREPPLVAGGVVGRGDVAVRLVERLLAGDLADLEGVGGDGLVVVLGPQDRLPWVDGASYLGRDPEAPALWLPTRVSPTVPVDWLQGAVLRICPVGAPIAVLAEPSALVPLGAARPLVRARLEAWLRQ